MGKVQNLPVYSLNDILNILPKSKIWPKVTGAKFRPDSETAFLLDLDSEKTEFTLYISPRLSKNVHVYIIIKNVKLCDLLLPHLTTSSMR